MKEPEDYKILLVSWGQVEPNIRGQEGIQTESGSMDKSFESEQLSWTIQPEMKKNKKPWCAHSLVGKRGWKYFRPM